RFQQLLAQAVDGEVRFDRFTRAMHATDASVYQILPMGVVAPRHRDDVLTVIKLCRQHGVPITARGGGTSQAGQSIGNGISLDFSRHMNRLLELDLEERTAWVEPGLVLDELNAQLKLHGLQLPLDLSTSSRATIGGMIANNSAGTRSIIYGKTIDYVEALTVVLADGSVVEIGDLNVAALDAKCTQRDLEGAAYRTVRQLGIAHRDEIEQRYPKIQRRVGGYNLDEFVPEKVTVERPFNLARMLVGSEGTLAMTLAAKVRLVPLPKHKVLCAIHFADLLDAMTATPIILTHAPSAVELVDRLLLDATRGKIEFEPLRDFIQGDPDAVLLVEFYGESAAELSPRLDRLEADLQQRGLGYHFHRAVTPAAQARIWSLRQAALGLTMAETGDAKSISFVEDTAVPTAHLHDYIETFQRILAEHQISAAFYAHASVGLLHIRPVVNMKTAEGVRKFASIAGEVADLVLEYGGALSGEHGDGLVRAPFQEKIFGSVLYQAFCQVKEAFDPTGLFNPGKIVHAPPLTKDLRYGNGYVSREIDTAFDFSDFGGFQRAAEQCSGVGACRKTLTGTMCPSYMATRNEMHTTRGRANALRLAISGQLDTAELAHEELLPVLDLCLECKACKRECPTGVDMARLKSEVLHQIHQQHGTTLADRLVADMERVSRWGSRLAPFVNWVGTLGFTRQLNEQLLGFDRRRPLPTFAGRSFQAQWQVPTEDTMPTVALFTDTFNNFYEPAHLTAAATLLGQLGATVTVPPFVCCGRPQISKGFLDKAAAQAAATTRTLLPLAQAGLPILFVEPSCYSAVVDDHPRLLRGEAQSNAQQVAATAQLVDTWAATAMYHQTLQTGPKRVLYHGHCHQKALVGTQAAVKLLSAIPDCEVVALDSGCCGMAGSFGYQHYEISQAIGEQRLFPALRDLPTATTVVAPGFSCRHQIEHFTGVRAETASSLLASLFEDNQRG
ncbi:MAG TPA: FAD-linked oxidase C-terminal domain-containing protein, partial [Caldilineaceae bacterium]|nr:FAD-linked oxidase C-terminal domain-containing protein [Caldilineaceae bacterium]